ncbi:MAG: ABC transporter permease [Anaerolineales bacterium]
MTVSTAGRIGALRTGWAFMWLDIITDLSYPMTLLFRELSSVLSILIYYFVARLVPNGSFGGDYFTTAAVGLATAATLQAALSGFGGRLQEVQDRGNLETLLVEPIRWTMIPFALNIWRTVVGFFSGAVMLLTAAALGANFSLGGLPRFCAVLLLSTGTCMGIGLLSASLLVLSKRSQPVLILYGMAASLLGGALFPVSVMPGWLQALSHAVPHRYAIEGTRAALMEAPPAGAPGLAETLVVLLVFNVVVFCVGRWTFSRALQYARHMGLLSGY